MKSTFAIKKDVLLRIIEASEDYERHIGDHLAPIDVVMDGSAVLELEKCGYIIRLPVTDIEPIEWSGLGYALVDVVVLPAVEETLSAIDGRSRIDEVHIKTFAPGATDTLVDVYGAIAAVKMMYFTIAGDIAADDRLQVKLLRVVPFEFTFDIEEDNRASLHPNKVVGITTDEVMEILSGASASPTTVVAVSLKQDLAIQDSAAIEAASTSGIDLVQDIDLDVYGDISLLSVQPFAVKQDTKTDLVYRLDPRKAFYLVLHHDVAVEGDFEYVLVEVAGLSATQDIAADNSCVVSIERSTVFGDYADSTFGDFGAQTFNELLRIVV